MRALVAAALVLLAGCQKSFDDRYADAQKKLNEQAASIDKEIAARESEAAPVPVSSQAPASARAAPPDRIPRP